MPGLLPGDIVQPDPGLSHLKTMSSIVRLIEQLPPGAEVAVTAIAHPGPVEGPKRVYYSVRFTPSPNDASAPTEPFVSAADIIEREIAEAECDDMRRHH